MSDLKMNDQNDLLIENGDLSLVDGSDAIAQDLQQTMQLWLGEWFLDTTKGIPYRQVILVKNADLNLIQATLTNAARAVNGVTDIVSFQFDYDKAKRALSATIEAKETTGSVIKAQAQIGLEVGG